jgi:hypothetical protein
MATKSGDADISPAKSRLAVRQPPPTWTPARPLVERNAIHTPKTTI